MEFKIDNVGSSIPCVRLAGRLDIAGTQAVDLKFTANTSAQRKSVIVDLSGVDFIASIGIRMLVTNAKALSTTGHKMVLLQPQPKVEDMLKSTGIDTIIPIASDLDAAIKIAAE
jgi:anti-sigma B factor antagonist